MILMVILVVIVGVFLIVRGVISCLNKDKKDKDGDKESDNDSDKRIRREKKEEIDDILNRVRPSALKQKKVDSP